MDSHLLAKTVVKIIVSLKILNMQNLIYVVREHRTYLFIALIFLMYFFLKSGSPYDFQARTFKGITDAGSIIALNISSQNGVLEGYGFHEYKSGALHNITLTGYVEKRTGKFSLKEKCHSHNENPFYGKITGYFREENKRLSGTWNNPTNDDPTRLSLIHTNKTPDEVLESESPHHIRRYIKEKTRKAGGAVNGVWEAIIGK